MGDPACRHLAQPCESPGGFIAGLTVEAVGADGSLAGKDRTDQDGEYLMRVAPGTYVVWVKGPPPDYVCERVRDVRVMTRRVSGVSFECLVP